MPSRLLEPYLSRILYKNRYMFPIWTTIFNNSVLNLILYGPRFRMGYSLSWKYLEIGFSWIARILEILEIEVFNILPNPGNIGKLIFSVQSYPGNIGSYDPYINPILEILDRMIQYFQGRTDIWIVRSSISRIGLINSKSCSI